MTNTVTQTRAAINGFYRQDETRRVTDLIAQTPWAAGDVTAAQARAHGWVEKLRQRPADRTLLEDFMQRYSLSTKEGIALMAVAECFLRVPDREMADKLIIDKITSAAWNSDTVEGEKLLTKMSGWGLNFSEMILNQQGGLWGSMVQRLGLPVIRQAMAQAIKLLGGQFVCGRTIDEAQKNAAEWKQKNYTFSYDMLGEGARMLETAEDYFKAYVHAIETVGKASGRSGDMYRDDGVSVKISALHPRYEELQKEHCIPILVDRLRTLALKAAEHNLLLTIDAEECERLEISLDIFEAVFTDPALANYQGLGLAVQAYQKRAVAVIDYLVALARQQNKKICIRLVKGAYWDSEVKKAQERGLNGYPVFTRKLSTDLSYLVAADKMLAAGDALYPAFATHNAFTVSAIYQLAKRHGCKNYEFQRLHGMGQQLYDIAYAETPDLAPCRIYAPVGSHRELLPYLVRRLLENGANSSFVHQLYDTGTPIEKLTQDPFAVMALTKPIPHPAIPLPKDLYGNRRNSAGPDLSDRADVAHLQKFIADFKPLPKIQAMDMAQVDSAMEQAQKAFVDWSTRPTDERADLIDKIADQFELHRDELLSYLVKEARKTIGDAVSELREAVDFCRYYAQQARYDFSAPIKLPGPTGESNILYTQGRGVFICVSPWNFPLAIFTGQVVAALVTGNCVLAKPAEQTPAVAAFAVSLMHKAGVPQDVVCLTVGSGRTLGSAMIAHKSTAGVVFTGSTETAWTIQRTLADKRGPIVPLIAETGGQNVMIADSTALPEQIIDDVIRSSFASAGQRCSALRVLYLQEEISKPVIEMLSGAMQLLRIGDPADFATDVGPVIDTKAKDALNKHAQNFYECRISAAQMPHITGDFVVPQIFRISKLSDLEQENFGPLLHIITYKADELDQVLKQIDDYGYGLTLGIHSRVEQRIDYIAHKVRVGNIYVNRSMIGAVVGVQPFGGMGLSGTGPKAGGPFYLHRFITEKTITTNTTAAGGNTSLTTLSEAM